MMDICAKDRHRPACGRSHKIGGRAQFQISRAVIWCRIGHVELAEAQAKKSYNGYASRRCRTAARCAGLTSCQHQFAIHFCPVACCGRVWERPQRWLGSQGFDATHGCFPTAPSGARGFPFRAPVPVISVWRGQRQTEDSVSVHSREARIQQASSGCGGSCRGSRHIVDA